jgi:SAM-dependent methyltransferase
MSVNDCLVPLLKKHKCRSFLDVGCSYGGVAAKIKAIFPEMRVLGIDISRNFIREAKQMYPEIDYRVMDIRKPLPVKKFDVAHTVGVFIHIQHENIEKAIRNVMRAAKVGLFTESMGEEERGTLTYDPKVYWDYRCGKKEQGTIDANTQYYFCHNYRKLFKKLGFRVKVVRKWDDKAKTRLYEVT